MGVLFLNRFEKSSRSNIRATVLFAQSDTISVGESLLSHDEL